MKTYNRSLDHVALALNAGRKGNHTLAAKLFAKAISQPDVVSAIQTLEASNAHAFKLMSAAASTARATAAPANRARRGVSASRRLRANDEVFDELEANDMGMDDMDMEDMDDAADMEDLEASDDDNMGMGMDMDDTEDDAAPAETMASVLRSMTRRRGR